MKHIIPFKIFEDVSPEDIEKLENIKLLQSVGILDSADARKLRAEVYNGNPAKYLNDPSTREAFESPEFKSLQDIGYSLDSTMRQFLNGTLILKIGDTPFRLGIFDTTKKIRRMMPKGSSNQDAPVKAFPEQDTTDFYKAAFAWIRDNIDHKDSNLATVRTTRSLANAANKRAETISKFSGLWKKLGLDEASISDLTELFNRWSSVRPLSETHEVLKETRIYFKEGLLYLPGWIIANRISSLESVISNNNIKWTTYTYIFGLESDLGIFETCTPQFTAISTYSWRPNGASSLYLKNIKITQKVVDTINNIYTALTEDDAIANNGFRVLIEQCSFNIPVKVSDVGQIHNSQINSQIEVTPFMDGGAFVLNRISGNGSINLLIQTGSTLDLFTYDVQWSTDQLLINGVTSSEFLGSHTLGESTMGRNYIISVSKNGEITATTRSGRRY